MPVTAAMLQTIFGGEGDPAARLYVIGSLALTAAIVLFALRLHSEVVQVKYRGAVELRPFSCSDTARSSFVKRVCYDKANNYMLINLSGTYYHYCAIDDGTVSALLAAVSMGRFYNKNIKGQFDCRVHQVPGY
jgi:hypothetical protein